VPFAFYTVANSKLSEVYRDPELNRLIGRHLNQGQIILIAGRKEDFSALKKVLKHCRVPKSDIQWG
jgi:hypothetical protein